MPRVMRTYEMDLEDLLFQIARSDQFNAIREDFVLKRLADDAAQERISDLIDVGRCRLNGDRGIEQLEWSLAEAEAAKLIRRLYREYLGAD